MRRAPGARRGWSLRARLTAFAAALVALALTGGAFALAAVVSSSRVAALDEVVRDRVWLVAQLAASDQVPDVLPVAEPGEVAQLLGFSSLSRNSQAAACVAAYLRAKTRGRAVEFRRRRGK
jgi:hypothetical protein